MPSDTTYEIERKTGISALSDVADLFIFGDVIDCVVRPGRHKRTDDVWNLGGPM